ncbi:uncharacterized protein PG986_008128 [Apiospora aurea]|uniref:Myosin-binding domain-containing protein n=1 Tax=Apiospora aurea TaxID=335848 RepID=A0ABR1QEJ2_9PEZI
METSYEPGGPHDEYQTSFEGQGHGVVDTDHDSSDDHASREQSPDLEISPATSPKPSFAPSGQAKPIRRFKNRIPSPLNLDIPKLDKFQHAYTKAVKTTVDGHGSRKFLEQLQWIINSSQLLDTHTLPAFASTPLPVDIPVPDAREGSRPWSSEGAIVAASLGIGTASLVRWFYIGGVFTFTLTRLVVAVVSLCSVVFGFSVYMRRQWLKYIHVQTLSQVKLFIQNSAELDSMAGAAIGFITEVELIARGYRLRIEGNGQSVKSVKIRRELNAQMLKIMNRYFTTARAIREFSNQELLRFHEQGKQCDPESIGAALDDFRNTNPGVSQFTSKLKESYVTVQGLRKMFLLSLFCLEPQDASSDYLRFTTALEGLRLCNDVTESATAQIQRALMAEETFNLKSPGMPLSPDREKWKHQVRKIGLLNNSIRGLQAKMVLLAEESNKVIDDEHGDMSHLGSTFMSQYEMIGKDLKALMEAWETGKAAVASAINRNEKKRVSSTSMLSPVTSVSELASVSEESDGPDAALRRLNGDHSPPTEPGSPANFTTDPVEYEAIAETATKPRSTMTREERIKSMQEERASKILAREKAMESGWFMGELKSVLQHRGEETLSAGNNRNSKRRSIGASGTGDGTRPLTLSAILPSQG